jgi:beta-glucosidase
MQSFECFSEDPFLSGMMAASFVNGVQKGGIGTTIKHFVCAATPQACRPNFDLLSYFRANDKEEDRHGYDRILSARALREIYLMPFMLAQKHAQPWSYMTA